MREWESDIIEKKNVQWNKKGYLEDEAWISGPESGVTTCVASGTHSHHASHLFAYTSPQRRACCLPTGWTASVHLPSLSFFPTFIPSPSHNWFFSRTSFLNTMPLSITFFNSLPAVSLSHGDNMCACLLSCFNCVWFLVTLWTVAHQAPLSMEFSRQE